VSDQNRGRHTAVSMHGLVLKATAPA